MDVGVKLQPGENAAAESNGNLRAASGGESRKNWKNGAHGT